MFFVFLFCGLVYILIFLNMPLCALLQEDLHFPLMLRQGLLIGWDTPASIQVLSPKVLTSGFSSPLSGAGGLPHTSGQISVVTFKFLPGLNAFSVFAVDQSATFACLGETKGEWVREPT